MGAASASTPLTAEPTGVALGKPTEQLAGQNGRPAMGFNLEGLGLGAAAMLHLLLLAVFITAFFWMPKIGPASSYKENMEYFASNIGYTMLSALNNECVKGGNFSIIDIPPDLVTYTQEVEQADNKDQKANNRKLLIASLVGLGVVFVIMIIIIIVAKTRHHRVDWGRMVAYCFGVFLLFCAFELALYFVVIQNYMPISNAQMGDFFINQLRRELLRMESPGYTPPREVPAGLPKAMHPVLVFALRNLENLVGPVRELDQFRNTPRTVSAAAT